MFNYSKKALAIGALAAFPAMASAATVSNDVGFAPGIKLYQQSINAGEASAVFNFTATDRFKIDNFLLSGQGLKSDVTNTTYTIVNPDSTGVFTGSFGVPSNFTGSALVDGASYKVGDQFSIAFDVTPANVDKVGYTISFETSAVPVPAAGMMLLAALGGAAALRRRKKAVAA